MVISISTHNHLFLLLISSIIFGLDLNSSKILNSGIKNVLLPRKRTLKFYIKLKLTNFLQSVSCIQMERMREIESPSQPWQGRILTTKLHPHGGAYRI